MIYDGEHDGRIGIWDGETVKATCDGEAICDGKLATLVDNRGQTGMISHFCRNVCDG